ncbi:MAG TPA: ParB/RepB/Spo0J family partition protein [Acetivibrio sp.]|nr:ParB/RepB/Spo0J family partition protein [Clostridium sp.]HOQ36792.1 ParB/RepB/Spo0J family partition protein [Acetivibrio sp.]HPT90427.1 ParB/RepB/Spo0J family partition protein [Acetivibrio sp.]HQA56525.1 ParB/RepB/Spo0J family partition protein [Acetivibrio sp.]
MNKKGLGKGLGALISAANEEVNEEINEKKGIVELKINDIEPNINQPRKKFDDEKLLKLSESIKKHGVVQPIIVKKEDNTYRIVAGERRWRAARMAGLKTIPVIIKELSERQVMEIALIENLQREDLNPIEEAEAFERLLNEYNLTQEELSEAIGRSRSAIANTIRLLGLSEKVKNCLINQDITSGHARAILSVDNKELQEKICDEIIEKNLTVRQTETLVKRFISEEKKENKKNKENKNNDEYLKIEENLQGIFGTKVRLVSNNKKGRIMIEYYSEEELDRLLTLFGMIEKK